MAVGCTTCFTAHRCTNAKCGHGTHCEDDNDNPLAIILPLLISELAV